MFKCKKKNKNAREAVKNRPEVLKKRTRDWYATQNSC